VNTPRKPSRKGLSREDSKPMPKHKKLLMLWQIVSPELSLKKYSEAYDLSYGTVRNWNVEPQYNELQERLQLEYIDLFINKLKGLIEDSQDLEALSNLLNEVGNYSNLLLIIGIQRELSKLVTETLKKIKHQERPPQPSDLFVQHAYDAFIFSTLSKGLLKNHTALRDVKESYCERQKASIGHTFQSIREVLKDGNTEKAMALMGLLESMVLPNIDHLKEYVLEYHDLKYGIKK
jgi:hypothetical protein